MTHPLIHSFRRVLARAAAATGHPIANMAAVGTWHDDVVVVLSDFDEESDMSYLRNIDDADAGDECWEVSPFRPDDAGGSLDLAVQMVWEHVHDYPDRDADDELFVMYGSSI